MSATTNAGSRRTFLPMVLSALLGLVVGGAVASGISLLVLYDQEARHQAELAALAGDLDPTGLVRSAGDLEPTGLVRSAMGTQRSKGPQSKGDSEEDKVLEFGKAFVADLENNRLASAYRSTSASYQKQTERNAFDEMIAKCPDVRKLCQIKSSREYKARKSPDAKGYEFYCTAHSLIHGNSEYAFEYAFGPRVNFALTLSQENGAWKVNDLEITVEKPATAKQ